MRILKRETKHDYNDKTGKKNKQTNSETKNNKTKYRRQRHKIQYKKLMLKLK